MTNKTVQEKGYPQVISAPEYSKKWECQLFSMGKHGLIFKPLKGKTPNWFWRAMQFMIVGNKWVRIDKE